MTEGGAMRGLVLMRFEKEAMVHWAWGVVGHIYVVVFSSQHSMVSEARHTLSH